MAKVNVSGIDTFAFLDRNTTDMKPFITSIDLNNIPFYDNSMWQTFSSSGVIPNLQTVTNINNSVTNMEYTFYGCRKLTTVPTLPTNVTTLNQAFVDCTNMTGTLNIPNGVRNIYAAFHNCQNLTTVNSIPQGVTNMRFTFAKSGINTCPTIPNTVTDMYQTFGSCFNLINPPAIPNSVTDLPSTFVWDRITDIPDIPDSVTSLTKTFHYCESLTDVANSVNTLSNNLTEMYQTFARCFNMTSTPTIPNSVTNMFGSFFDCRNLPATPIIPDSVTNMAGTFHGCDNITNISNLPPNVVNLGAGGTDMLPEIPGNTHVIGSGTFAYCRSLPVENVPTIPNSVLDMTATFAGCISFNATPILPQNVINIAECFMDCTNITEVSSSIPMSVTNMCNTFSNCANLTGDINIEALEVANVANCFYNTSITKNVYIPYTYTNGIFTTTYNTFTSAGYTANSATSKEGVLLRNNTPVTLTIEPLPSDATVTLVCGDYQQQGNSITVSRGQSIQVTVSKGGTSSSQTVVMGTANQTIQVQLYATLTIAPTPSNSTVVLTASGYTQQGNSITVPAGTAVSYTVSYSGLDPQSDTYIVNQDETMPVALTYTPGTVLFEKSIAGTYSFTPIAPVNCNIICVGGGGGTSFAHYTGTAASQLAYIAAGGSGGYSNTTNIISSTVTINVGNYSTTETGGTSSVGNLCSASGGQAGYASTTATSYGGPGGTGTTQNGNTGELLTKTFTTSETVTVNGGASRYNSKGTGCSITVAHSRRGTTSTGNYIHSYTEEVIAGTAGYVKIVAA